MFFAGAFQVQSGSDCGYLLMPFIDDKTLLKLPVETESGAALGRVAGFELDAAAHVILRYRVRPRGLASRVLSGPLLVAREQVVSLDAEKMVVRDAVARELELAQAEAIGLVTRVKA